MPVPRTPFFSPPIAASMNLRTPLAQAATLLFAASIAQGQDVRLNEIYASMSGTDFDEYIELIGTPGTSLDNFLVCTVEGQLPVAGDLDRVWDLTGTTIPASGYFVMSNTGSAIPNQNFDLANGPHLGGASDNIENGAQTVYLVQAATALATSQLVNNIYATNIDPDGDLNTVLADLPVYTIIDAIGMYDGDSVADGDLVFDCAPIIGPDGTFFPSGAFCPGDAPADWCTDSFTDFFTSIGPVNTPGAMNHVTGCIAEPSSAGCGSGNMVIGTNYCGPAVPNTSGLPAEITATGSTIAAFMDLTLTATDLPPGQFAYFVGSENQGFIQMPNGSQGNLCVIGNIARFNTQVGQSSPSGEFAIVVDTQNIPVTPSVAIMSGDTWNFQCWTRDFIAGSGPTSNFSNGVSITFQ